MKKIICLLLALCLCLALAGCSHDHTAEALWSVGIDGHWHACEKCDEPLDYAPHSFDENGNCTVCTAGIFETADGSKEAKAYDDHGSLVLHVTYGIGGEIATDTRRTFEYFSDGSVKNLKTYTDRVLAEENVFLPCKDPANGATYLAESIYYYTNVCTVKSEFNEAGYIQQTTTYDANGEVHTVDRYEYEFDAAGNRTKTSIYTNDALSRVMDHVNHKMYDYDMNGEISLTRAYEYDDNGNPLTEAVYIYDKLDTVSYYKLAGDGTCYVYKTLHYNRDGEVEKEVYYDANGKEIK